MEDFLFLHWKRERNNIRFDVTRKNTQLTHYRIYVEQRHFIVLAQLMIEMYFYMCICVCLIACVRILCISLVSWARGLKNSSCNVPIREQQRNCIKGKKMFESIWFRLESRDSETRKRHKRMTEREKTIGNKA